MFLRSRARVILAIACIGTMAASPMIGGCVSTRARDKVMEPVLVGVSPAVMADAERGLDAAPSEDGANAITELFDSVALGDQVSAAITVRLHWPTVYDLAYAGIAERLAAGEIGPNGAKSFENRVEEYGARLFQWIGD